MKLRASVFAVLSAVATLMMPAGAGAAQATCGGLSATIVGVRHADGQATLIRGTSARDVIVGTPGRDVIRGLGGNDIICGGGARDIVFGGLGEDTIYGEGGSDKLVGGGGTDTVYGGGGRDILKGGSGADRIFGGNGIDRCFDNRATIACEWINSAPAAKVDTNPVRDPITSFDDPNATLTTAQFNSVIEDEILRLVNVERARSGVAPLVRDGALSTGARNWAATLASPGAPFRHDPNLDNYTGENIAQNYVLGTRTVAKATGHAADLMGQWMGSSGHRRNILDGGYYSIGVGVVMSDNLTYATQRFSIVWP